MPLRSRSAPTDWERIDRWEAGVGWIAHPGERMQRASHALAVDGEVWVVDPLDVPGLDDLLGEFGDVAGVVVTLDRHSRDAAVVARRHDVPVSVPSFVDVAVDGPTTTVGGSLGDTGFETVRVVENPVWTEAALFDGETLVVGDALGTAGYFLAPGERLGVHPMLRLTPPRVLRGLQPARVVVGHGRGVLTDAPAALLRALDGARANAPAAWLRGLRGLLPGES